MRDLQCETENKKTGCLQGGAIKEVDTEDILPGGGLGWGLKVESNGPDPPFSLVVPVAQSELSGLSV